MRRMLLILAHEAGRRTLDRVRRAARVPFCGVLKFSRGRWCVDRNGNSSGDARVLYPHPHHGLTFDFVDEIERGRVLTVVTHAWHDGGGEVFVFLSDREVTGDVAAAMAREYDEWLNTPDEAEAT